MNNFKWGFIAAGCAFIASFGIGLLAGVAVFHIILRAVIFAAVFFGIGFGLKFAVSSFFPELLMDTESYEGSESYEQQAGQRVNITLDTAGEYAVPELFKSPGAPDELGNINDLLTGYFKPRQEGVDRNTEGSYNQNDGFDSEDIFPNIPEEEPLHFQKDESFQDMPRFERAPHVEKSVENRQNFNPSLGDGSDGLGGLPDLDAMAMAFSAAGGHSSDGFGKHSSDVFGGHSSDDFGGFSSDSFSSGDSGGDFFGPGTSDGMEPETSHFVGNKPQTLKGDFNPKELAEGIRTVLSKEK